MLRLTCSLESNNMTRKSLKADNPNKPSITQWIKAGLGHSGSYLVEKVWRRSSFGSMTVETALFKMTLKPDEDLLEFLKTTAESTDSVRQFCVVLVEVDENGEYALIYDDEITLYEAVEISVVEETHWFYKLATPYSIGGVWINKLKIALGLEKPTAENPAESLKTKKR